MGMSTSKYPLSRMGMRQKFDTRWVGYGDDDEFVPWGSIWDSEICLSPMICAYIFFIVIF